MAVAEVNGGVHQRLTLFARDIGQALLDQVSQCKLESEEISNLGHVISHLDCLSCRIVSSLEFDLNFHRECAPGSKKILDHSCR